MVSDLVSSTALRCSRPGSPRAGGSTARSKSTVGSRSATSAPILGSRANWRSTAAICRCTSRKVRAGLIREVLRADQDHVVGDDARVDAELREEPAQRQDVHRGLRRGGAHLRRIGLAVDHREGLHLGDVEPRGRARGGTGRARAQGHDVGLDVRGATADVQPQQRVVGQQRLARRDAREQAARPLVPRGPVDGHRRRRIGSVSTPRSTIRARDVEAQRLAAQQLEQRRAAVGLDLLLEGDPAGDRERRLAVARREAGAVFRTPYDNTYPLEVRNHLPDEVLSSPVGQTAIMHTHNTMPSMAQRYHVPMWQVPSCRQRG